MSNELMNHPMVSKENWNNFTQSDHEVWNILFNKQMNILENRASDELLEGICELNICKHQIPKMSEINNILQRRTGFAVVPVKGFIPEDLFFKFLAERKFPTTCFIRQRNQLDYLEEPDIFHDVFGHVPLLANPMFANFMEAFGKKGLEAIDLDMLKFASTLYWFTVEFGLIKRGNEFRIYGAGIASSTEESVHSINSNKPVRLNFDVERVFRTNYRIDALQNIYFVIEDFQQLFDALHQLDWQKIKKNNIEPTKLIQETVIN